MMNDNFKSLSEAEPARDDEIVFIPCQACGATGYYYGDDTRKTCSHCGSTRYVPVLKSLLELNNKG